MPVATSERGRRTQRTQSERRARSRNALLEAAARGLSRHGYHKLVLERVAADAGYTRGALYHQFANKEELALAVVAWVRETWWAEMAPIIEDEKDPVAALIAVARTHAVFCRRDIARVHMVLNVEFSGNDHPVGQAIQETGRLVVAQCVRLIEAARRSGGIPPGPSSEILALAYLGAVEGLVINLAGKAPYDEMLVERAVRGVLGLSAAAG